MKTWILRLAPVLFLALCQCSDGVGGTTTGNPLVTEDTSTSGSAAGAVGGSLSGSSGASSLAFNFERKPILLRGTAALFGLIPQALADNSCPTYASSSGAGCSVSGETMWLDYSGCSFGQSKVTWTGTQAISISSGAAPACGTFPDPASGGDLYRQYVTAPSSTTPSFVTLHSPYGTAAVIDDASVNLSNFDGDSITTIRNGGYGSDIGFTGSERTSIAFGHRILISSTLDHTVTTQSTPITITRINSSSRYVNGTVTVYHNLLKIVGTATFTNVVHSDTCCYPVSGTISTFFSAGTSVAPTTLGNLMINHTETLELTGCGTGTLKAYDGTVANVVLTRCF